MDNHLIAASILAFVTEVEGATTLDDDTIQRIGTKHYCVINMIMASVTYTPEFLTKTVFMIAYDRAISMVKPRRVIKPSNIVETIVKSEASI